MSMYYQQHKKKYGPSGPHFLNRQPNHENESFVFFQKGREFYPTNSRIFNLKIRIRCYESFWSGSSLKLHNKVNGRVLFLTKKSGAKRCHLARWYLFFDKKAVFGHYRDFADPRIYLRKGKFFKKNNRFCVFQAMLFESFQV